MSLPPSSVRALIKLPVQLGITWMTMANERGRPYGNRRLRSQSEEFWFGSERYFDVLRTERSTSENCIKVHNLVEFESKPNSKMTRLKMRIVFIFHMEDTSKMCGAATTCEREFSVPPKKGRRFLRLSESTKKKASAYGRNWRNVRGPFYRDLFHIHRSR
jgi:hypothetical protein